LLDENRWGQYVVVFEGDRVARVVDWRGASRR
jgi:hypothetical protein